MALKTVPGALPMTLANLLQAPRPNQNGPAIRSELACESGPMDVLTFVALASVVRAGTSIEAGLRCASASRRTVAARSGATLIGRSPQEAIPIAAAGSREYESRRGFLVSQANTRPGTQRAR
jgi:hypothetical protein